METATLLEQVTALKNELDAVDVSITAAIAKTREIESAILLCESEKRSWEDEERKVLTEHFAFATQADDFDNLKQALLKERNALDEEVLLAKQTKDSVEELLETHRLEFVNLCKSFQKKHEHVDLAKDRKDFDVASERFQKSVERLTAEFEIEKKQMLERERVKRTGISRLRDKREGLKVEVTAGKQTLAAAEDRARRVSTESEANKSGRTLSRLRGELETVEDEIAALNDCNAGIQSQIPKLTNEIWMLENRIKQKRAQCDRLEQRVKVQEISEISACFEASLAEEANDYFLSERDASQGNGAALTAPPPFTARPSGQHRMDIRTHHWTPRGPYRKNVVPLASPQAKPPSAEQTPRAPFRSTRLPQSRNQEVLADEAPATEDYDGEPAPVRTRLPARRNRPQLRPLFDYDDDDFMRPYTGSAKITELDDQSARSDEDVELLNYKWNRKRSD